jgi:excinuclease ABC subunit C
MFDSKAFLDKAPSKPGVYQMQDATGDVIYVGKAKNLKKRLSQYFQKKAHDAKTMALVKHIEFIQLTIAPTETEALLLESNLIKRFKPRYNVLFKDDKSYPYVLLTEHEFPRLQFMRGKKGKGEYFGPYPSSHAVRETLTLLHKTFKIRNCSNSVFANRSRPCLQYQIKRCSAPCVKFISPEAYQADLALVRQFLVGENDAVLATIATKMQAASDGMDFEAAAQYRDQLQGLQKLQAAQVINSTQSMSVDVLAVSHWHETFVVHALFVREGRILGSQSFFPKGGLAETDVSVLEAFMAQYYQLGRGQVDCPAEVVMNKACDVSVLKAALAKPPQFKPDVRGVRAKWVKLAVLNAGEALRLHCEKHYRLRGQLEALAGHLELKVINRMECFDISHFQGDQTVASCVVFDDGGATKQRYRRFNIKDITPGDDYAAIAQAVSRRYARLIKGEHSLPELVIIDGGKGQLSAALAAFAELESKVQPLFIGVAKGPERVSGAEDIVLPGGKSFQLPEDDPGFLVLRAIRDEAHRFAITGHRSKRDGQYKSKLEQVEGIGPAKRRALLNHFGSLNAIQDASVDELIKIKGIDGALATRIKNT